ncbi:hypothetical protein BDL97_09G082900 [Sphagnum fallax]|nr:hypothetical protein BDL97_09G082900 [Sphagnum fallax]
MHWSPLTRKGTEVLNLAGPVQELGHVQISTMCVKQNLLVASGFQGEMVCKETPTLDRICTLWCCTRNLDHSGISHCAKITYDENAIGAVQLMSSNYDAVIRVFICNNFSLIKSFCFPWAVKAHIHQPRYQMMVVVGDNADGLLSDSQGGKVIATLKGHLDCSFASAWHPDGQVFLTGNQDTTFHLWDIQNLGSSLGALKGYIGAIHSLPFTSKGCFLAMAEPADFVHVFDTKQDCAKCISFSPDSEALYVGVVDRTYGSLLEFNQSHPDSYVNCLL